MIFIPLALATEKSRELAIAVGAAHMAQKEGWAVKKMLEECVSGRNNIVRAMVGPRQKK